MQVDVLYSFVCHKAGGHGLEEMQFNKNKRADLTQSTNKGVNTVDLTQFISKVPPVM